MQEVEFWLKMVIAAFPPMVFVYFVMPSMEPGKLLLMATASLAICITPVAFIIDSEVVNDR